ncbi:MAG: DUF2281 domain-containing protein [Sphingobacteriaceae bacterium]|nr:MAG: DUF2281 domain-containing protein [Sphingobacteriaceae bacterium]
MVLAKDIIEKIERVPEELKPKLAAFVDELLEEAKQHLNQSVVQERQFGAMKGLFGTLPDDFNEPLEDFKDYM